MKYLKTYLLIAFTLVLIETSTAQQIGFAFPPDVKRVVIPFERINNLIIIPVTINNSITLKFILDTGVQYPILTEKLFAQFIGLQYSRRITIQGPGVADSITAKVVQNVNLTLPGGVTSGVNQALLVLEKDYLQLSYSLGAEVYGVIGYDIFSRFVVEINYDENYIVLHEPKKYRPKRSYKKLPIQVVNTKPYIKVGIKKDSGQIQLKNLMIDTGASHALLLDNSDNESLLPNEKIPSIIGRGLGGDINGYLGRMRHVELGKFHFEGAIASFPKASDYGNLMKHGSRNGTMGGDLLSRFHVVFDYSSGYLYLKKSRSYSRSFEADMSGIGLVVDGDQLKDLKVYSIRHESPAYVAGLRAGDVIKSINGYDLEILKFGEFATLLRLKDGKKITVKYERDKTPLKSTFKLKRYI